MYSIFSITLIDFIASLGIARYVLTRVFDVYFL